MPKPLDHLFEAFNTQDYTEVMKLIETHSELVNALDEDFNCPLFQLALLGSKPNDKKQDLLTFLLQHEKFDLSQRQTGKLTNLAAIISTGRSDLIKLSIKNPNVLIEGNDLAYNFAKEKLRLASISVGMQKPASISAKRAQERVDNLTEIVSMLLDATVLHVKDLQKAGKDASYYLSKLPAAFVEERLTPKPAAPKAPSDKVSAQALTQSSMSIWADLERQKEQLEIDFLQKRTALHKKLLDSSLKTIDDVLKIVKEEAARTDPAAKENAPAAPGSSPSLR